MMKAAYVKNSGLLLDDARELAFTFAYDNHIMDEKNDSVSSRADGYNAVTPEALRDCAREIFNKNNLTLTVKSNKKKTPREEILSLIETYL
jgi:predicted Zn-dependent peptidase